MSLTVILFLLILGLVLLVLEILVVPGGVLGVIALGMMGFAIYQAYVLFGNNWGHITLAATVVVSTGVVYLSLKSGAWNYFALNDKLEGKMNTIDEELLKVGDKGIAVSELRPMGNALFGDEKYEVSSEGEKIPVHTPVEVLRIEGNKIYVCKTEN